MGDKGFDQLDPRKKIIIKGARVHNLKNIDVAITKNTLTVITGLSGSGKSSLAFDTLYADGQRRYVESLSSYARQFFGKLNKPEVEYIKGIAPAIAIEQKVKTSNPRSTVGTSTEIYDYLKLLFARIGKTYSPVSGDIVKRDTVTDVVDYLIASKITTTTFLVSPYHASSKRTIKEELGIIRQQGFSRVYYEGKVERIDQVIENKKLRSQDFSVIIDRFQHSEINESLVNRIADSVQIAFYEGKGTCVLLIEKDGDLKQKTFSNKFELDGILFEEPNINLLSFNNPYGACKKCEGFGNVIGIDPDLVIPDQSLSVYEDAIVCWKGEKMSEWKNVLVEHAYKFDFPIHKPIRELDQHQIELLWEGNEYFNGLNSFFDYIESQSFKIQYRVMLSRYRGKTICPECKGTRLRKDAGYIKINNYSISDLVLLPISELIPILSGLKLSKHDHDIADRILLEISSRLEYLEDVGLGYLTINRLSNTLSGGESQRINLATSIGSSLVGSLYILDEPSIGLHPRDTHRLIKILKKLRDNGNTVIVVEHDEEIIRSADEVIDIGPLAGNHGGELVFQGNFKELVKSKESLTAKYFNKELKIALPRHRRKWRDFIELTGASEHNLKNISVRFPLDAFTVVSGVSGSGKTTLIKNILVPALKKIYGIYGERTGKFSKLLGDYNRIGQVEMVDQNPLGRSSRSNPATYVKAFDEIRTLFSKQKLSKMRGYKPGYFSFNIPGGRCEECMGEGVVKIEMQFMADIYLTCESCEGQRFRDEVLEVKYHQKSIFEVLNMTINEAIEFFQKEQPQTTVRIIERLKPLQDVGLGYLKLGQSSNSLSGGEAQRVKLAYFLSKGATDSPTLFVFDEPTTGLHFHDVKSLLNSFDALIDKGNTIIVIEHNMDVIKYADWLIDLGPEGGKDGGEVVFEGVPENIINNKRSHTAKYLKEKIEQNNK